MASLGIYIVENKEELTVLYNKSEKEIFNSYLKYESSITPEEPIIIQELLIGKEYGVDILNDLNKKFVTCFAKEKVKMRAGETDLGLTVNSEPFTKISLAVSKIISHKGILSMDCFLVDDEIYITEFNCRISGHYPISHVSGFNYPIVLKAWLNGISDIDSLINFKEGVYVCKDLSVRVLN
jgi:carbamoyl-phosphate synthase large subunit